MVPPRKQLGLGEHSPITTTPLQLKAGKWVKVNRDRRTRTDVWRARARYVDHAGKPGEVSHRATTEAQAVAKVEQVLRERLHASDTVTVGDTPFLDACERWLSDLERSDSGRSDRTVAEYRGAYLRCIRGVVRDSRGNVSEEKGSALSSLTLSQVNDVQRLTRFLRGVADERGTASVKHVRAVLNGVLGEGVRNGILARNAMRDVSAVRANTPARRRSERDTTRAFTAAELEQVREHVEAWAEVPDLHPATERQRRAVADLIAFLAGTGVRIGEALALRWEHVDLKSGDVDVPGTKSRASRRVITLPAHLLSSLKQRGVAAGQAGYVFSSPRLSDPEAAWDSVNCSKAVTAALTAAGFPWARSHTFRKTVATVFSESGVSLQRIADWLGHADPSMTASVYLGRSFSGPKPDMAELLEAATK